MEITEDDINQLKKSIAESVKLIKLKQELEKSNNIQITVSDLSKELDLPMYLYLQHWKTHEYKFIEINEEFVRKNFVHLKFVNKGHIFRKIQDQDYRIIIEAYNKITLFKQLKIRYDSLLHPKKEFDLISKLFNDNPEYTI